jgi:nitrogenase molybdenum-cofactor synthesis protein NifE
MSATVRISDVPVLAQRAPQVALAGSGAAPSCGTKSVAGSVSQRACVFCGSRVVLYPVADALHLVHGPIGCAAYTWDIRGALSSGPQLHRTSFCTDLSEREIIYGGEKKLYAALCALIDRERPAAAFVYATCIAGIIGDDIGGVCKRVAREKGIPVVPVQSEGFRGTKKDGYRAACDALFSLIEPPPRERPPLSVNILGDFNIAGETWEVKRYFERMGLSVVATMTGDGRIADIRRAASARLNIVQCSGSMMHLARRLEESAGMPYMRASFFGIEDTARALYDAADFFGDAAVHGAARELVKSEVAAVTPELSRIRARCRGKRGAVYVGGAFKAMSLVRALRSLGITTAVAGTQTGNADDYAALRGLCDPDTVIVDDSNPRELSSLLLARGVDLFIGGVKERPIAYKLGIGFCDHNHERKLGLAGFAGMARFAREVESTVASPVFRFVPRNAAPASGAPLGSGT